ncbi:hypothetical protein FUA22_17255 [Seonamhaeicola maritimus]|uniref:RHS repeat-associated core domain-containing protein n=2 Tax=Seonamhaeicola maritimus TaxID=2591822 RepID=A0A5C7GE09_9FLAO|nr:hypothetical protein FUA22_17255 [Seonamhaeicola maritimus]
MTKLDDFLGTVIESTTFHERTGHSVITTVDGYTYDHMNRLLAHEQEVNGSKKELIVRNHYDELGQLVKKQVGADVPITSEYQNRYGLGLIGTKIYKYNPASMNGGLSTFENFPDNGYVSFKATYNYYDLTAGLSYSDPDYLTNSIQYGINLMSDGTAQAMELGIHHGPPVSYVAGDSFRVERKDNIIYYSKNGVVFYISGTTSNGNPMIGDTAFTSYNGSIENFIIVNTNVALQNVDYAYNIRGWLKGINEDGLQDNDLFNFVINYNTPNSGTALYNGNISQVSWNTQSVNNTSNLVSTTYSYSYDALNRIINGTDNTGNYNLTNVSYDKNGNITNLQRKGHLTENNPTSFGTMDNLNYYYNANQLHSVTDVSNYTTGFNDGNASDTVFDNGNDDYEYDDNGNMTKDKNKGIISITYNHLNLPVDVSINGNGNVGTISYIYDATGVKLEKKVTENSTDTYTHYAGNYVYDSSSLKFFNHPEGYIEQNSGGSYDYIYQYKDHLGNVRLSYKGENDLVFYDDFESASGWNSNGAMYGTSLSYGNGHTKSGNFAGKLNSTATENKYSHCDNWIDISNSVATDYMFSGWIYLESTGGYGNSWARFVMFMNEETETNYYTLVEHSNASYTKNQWVYVEKRVTVPANIDKINFRVGLYNNNNNNNSPNVTAWFDNLSIRKADPSPDLEIVEENNYYPFGLKHKGYNTNVASTNIAQKWKYNDTEYEEALGMNLYEMPLRSYDPAIARWTTIDPVTHFSNSTYNAFDNNPIYWADPSGADSWTYVSNGVYRNNDTGEETNDWQRAIRETQAHFSSTGTDPIFKKTERKGTYYNEKTNMYLTFNNPKEINSNEYIKASGEISIGPQTKDGGTFLGWGTKSNVAFAATVASIEILSTIDETIINISINDDAESLKEMVESATFTVDLNKGYFGSYFQRDVEGNKEYGFNVAAISLHDGDNGASGRIKIKDGNTSFLGIGGIDFLGASYNIELIFENSGKRNYSVRGRVRRSDLEHAKKVKESKK